MGDFRSTWSRRGISYRPLPPLSVGGACQMCGLTEFGRQVRHYRMNVTSSYHLAPLVAWMHLFYASPWRYEPEHELRFMDRLIVYKNRKTASLATGAEALQGAAGLAAVLRIDHGDDVAQALVRGLGPVAIGGPWRDGMEQVDLGTGLVRYTGRPVGGHAVTLTGIDIRTGRVRFVNNRDPGWGQLGRAWLSLADLRKLVLAGEAYAVVPDVPVMKRVPPVVAPDLDPVVALAQEDGDC